MFLVKLTKNPNVTQLFESYLNQYKIPMTLTLSPMFLRTASPIVTYDIPVDSAVNGGGFGLMTEAIWSSWR